MSTLTAEQQRIYAQQVNLLTSPPPTDKAPPELAAETVAFYADPWWSSQNFTVSLKDYAVKKRHRLPQFMIDRATWVTWNLPLGKVMTVLDIPDSGRAPGDQGRSGWTLDLVGTGYTRSCELRNVELDDRIAAFVYRDVDLTLGAIEIFQHPDFRGNFATIFLAEWEQGKFHSIADWNLNDGVSSFRWRTLNDRQTATLYAHPGGEGPRYDNIKGWGSFKEISSAGNYGVDDTFSCFSWSNISPKLEIIKPIRIDTSKATGMESLSQVDKGNNDTPLAQSSEIKIEKTEGQSITVTTEDQLHAGMTVTASQSFSAGVENVASSTTTLELGFTYDYSQTKAVTTSTTTTINVSVSQTFNVPAKSRWEATLIAGMGRLKSTDHTTKATRWYDFPVTGGVQDPSKNNWWKRTEQVTFKISGSLLVSTQFNVKSTPLA